MARGRCKERKTMEREEVIRRRMCEERRERGRKETERVVMKENWREWKEERKARTR